jgi:H+/gluconate symporter-like permease
MPSHERTIATVAIVAVAVQLITGSGSVNPAMITAAERRGRAADTPLRSSGQPGNVAVRFPAACAPRTIGA